jgi:hypothetical protein
MLYVATAIQRITEVLCATIDCEVFKILFQHGLIKYMLLHDNRHNPLFLAGLILCH